MAKPGGDGFDLNKLKGVGGFLKRHGGEVAGAALSYKMGGGLGKMMAAGTAANLANKYQKEEKGNNKPPPTNDYQTPGGSGSYPQGGYGGPSSTGQYPPSSGQYGGAAPYNPHADPWAQPPPSPQYGVGDPYGNPPPRPPPLSGNPWNNDGWNQQPASQTTDGGYSGHSKKGAGGLSGIVSSGKGLLGKAERYVGKSVGGGTNSKSVIGGTTDIMRHLQPNATVYIISQMTGRPLQIVQGGDGRLTVDGNGMEGPQAFNAQFTVVRDAPDVVMLHNRGNYLSIFGGQLIVHFAPQPSPQCRLRVVSAPGARGGGAVVVFESATEPGLAIGVSQDGFSKYNCRTPEFEAQFVVRPVQIGGSSAYPMQQW